MAEVEERFQELSRWGTWELLKVAKKGFWIPKTHKGNRGMLTMIILNTEFSVEDLEAWVRGA